MITLSIVVPCFNEEEVLPETIARLGAVRAQLVSEGLVSEATAVWFVDDGSTDGTWGLIGQGAATHPWIRGLKLSRNRGHQNAILAGLFESDGDAVVTVDADLQDDLSAIREMVLRHAEGAEIVYGVRSSRRSDSFLKRATAETYYRVLRAFGVDIVFNHADYRLMGRRAIRALQEFSEVNLFLRGIVPQLGFRSERVYYARAERFAGESKYPVGKMLALAWDGITSYSTVPLRWITAIGFLVSLASFAVGAWAIWVRLTNPSSAPGWASTVVPISLLGGIQLLGLGIVGEYIGKIYAETKRRPRYVVELVVPPGEPGAGVRDLRPGAAGERRESGVRP